MIACSALNHDPRHMQSQKPGSICCLYQVVFFTQRVTPSSIYVRIFARLISSEDSYCRIHHLPAVGFSTLGPETSS